MKFSALFLSLFWNSEEVGMSLTPGNWWNYDVGTAVGSAFRQGVRMGQPLEEPSQGQTVSNMASCTWSVYFAFDIHAQRHLLTVSTFLQNLFLFEVNLTFNLGFKNWSYF